MALIDQGIIAKLVATRINTITQFAVRFMREQEPPADVWCRMMPLKRKGRPRTRGTTEPDLATIQGLIVVGVGPVYTSQYAGDTAAQRVIAALDEQTLRQDPFTGDDSHQLDILRADCDGLIQEDEQHGIQFIGVSFEAEAMRAEGTAVTDFLV